MTGKSREMDETPDVGDVEIQEDVVADPLAEAQAKADQYLDMARRLQADFDNYRKRTQRENEEFRKFACSSIVSDLLTIVDDLDRALEHAGEETEFVKGIRGIRANTMKVLESNGLQEIPSEGRFDPNVHEALCTVEGEEDDMVAEVFQKGYTLNGRVLRYSKVKVTRKTS
ncbi:MAG: nucleotide exchange factor GrpE [Candidatus Methanomethylophilaceae archaeon]|nr:nucleotide exchange factor GrpE [Candidatus Methanomethylophilaceae archaeon]